MERAWRNPTRPLAFSGHTGGRLAGMHLTFGLSCNLAMAQDRDDRRDDPGWYQSRESFYHEVGGCNVRSRTRRRVQASAFSGSDQYRITHTGKLATAGKFDQPQLDDVITSLTRVVADNHLSSRERDILTDDLNRMRDYREHHADWR